jgi:hypothetical protein
MFFLKVNQYRAILSNTVIHMSSFEMFLHKCCIMFNRMSWFWSFWIRADVTSTKSYPTLPSSGEKVDLLVGVTIRTRAPLNASVSPGCGR